MSLALLRHAAARRSTVAAARRSTVAALSSLLRPDSLSSLILNHPIISPIQIQRPEYVHVREFRATAVAMRTEFAAVSDFSDDDGGAPAAEKGGADVGLEIAGLGISEHIVKALAKKGIHKLFPIQKAVLEPAMQGRDMIGRARTGTGKTLAFGIPIMDKIIRLNEKNGLQKNPSAIVLAPTRELAKQVDKEFYESAPNLDTLCVYGGTPIQQQTYRLNQGVDIVVGTPGRVIDLLKRGSLNLSQVQFFVLDEADQMLNVGFAEDVETILQHLPQKRQTLMFSATMPSWIRKLTAQHLKNPLTVDLVGDSDQKLADGITLYSIATEMYEKPSIIETLITEHAKGGKTIVFTQTKRDADKLAYAMGKKLKCQALHGDISQNQRESTLAGFREARFNVLVATDVAARGLDVPNVDLIIHYELPMTSEIFVHRSGRTGRAGKKGTAILIYSSRQMRDVQTIERDVGCKFKQLPPIKVEGGNSMFNDMDGYISPRGGGGFGGGRGFGGGGGGGFGGGGFGRSSGYGSGRSGSSGGSGFSRSGGFGDRGGSDRGGFGSRSSGGFGGANKSSDGGFGDFRSSSFGDILGGGSGDKSTRRKPF